MALRFLPLFVIGYTWLAGQLASPYIWVFSGWTVACLAYAVATKRPRGRRVALALGAATLVLALTEILLTVDPHAGSSSRIEGNYGSADVYSENEVLGYGPAPSSSLEARRIVDGEPVYDVTYTYGPDRLRIAPPVEVDPPLGSILCFGCSFTLGEGVRDEETYAYRIGERSGRRYQVLNFGFHGYGPHQMLAALRGDYVEPRIDAAPKLVLYLTFPDHAPRASGRRAWDPHGPWYRLAGGRLERAGAFHDRPSPVVLSAAWISDRISASAIGRRAKRIVQSRLGPSMDEGELALFEAIVIASRDEVAKRFPGADFHVFALEGERAWNASLARIEAAGIPVHSIRATMPELAEGENIPMIPNDGHPTAAVYDAIARYVVEELLD